MSDAIAAYPLTWPSAFRRTPTGNRTRGAFSDHSLGGARDRLLYELRLLGAKSIVLSTMIPVKLDGLPYANYKPVGDPGVAVYFQRSRRNVCLACDRYTLPEINLYALGLTVKNMRAIERYGASDFLDRAFTGFAALSMPARKPWWIVLEIGQDATADIVKIAYRKLALQRHPDHGGTADAWQELERAHKEALEDIHDSTRMAA